MAGEQTDVDDPPAAGNWRRGWASAGAIVATILLIGLIVMVTLANRARDEALAWERHTYSVMMLARTVDATIARSEAALGRFVLDEDIKTGSLYFSEWRRAGRQIGQLRRLVRANPDQRQRIDTLLDLYRTRGLELANAAQVANQRQGSGGVPLFYQAGLSPTGPALRSMLDDIAASERESLRARTAETQLFDEQSDQLTEWLGWFGILIGLAAIGLGLAAYSAIHDRLAALAEADSESHRAMALDHAVQDRTRELRDANERLRAEGVERAAAEERLRQVQKMEAVGQLTGGIAHDFNNMLAVVVGGLDLARRKLGGPRRDVELHLDNAMEGATRAAALTRRLLAFARSEPLLPQGIAPSALIGTMLDLVDRAIGERIVVETRFEAEPWRVWADTHQFENAVLNLCVNARDAMGGEGHLAIVTENVALACNEVGALPAGDYVRVAVSDTGIGIAPEHIERVFEPFFTTKPVGKGTGLGLSQIFAFARQSGGDVAIASTLGVGTIVSLYLPRSSHAADQAAVAATPAPERQDAIRLSAGTAILVVEDDPRVSRSTVAALEELGYLPTACASGVEALEILARDPRIALVVTDVMMPEMTGPELVRIVGERFPHIAILFVTGFVGETGEAEELAGHDILRKPFTVAALSNAVADTLGRRLSESRPAAASAAAE